MSFFIWCFRDELGLGLDYATYFHVNFPSFSDPNRNTGHDKRYCATLFTDPNLHDGRHRGARVCRSEHGDNANSSGTPSQRPPGGAQHFQRLPLLRPFRHVSFFFFSLRKSLIKHQTRNDLFLEKELRVITQPRSMQHPPPPNTVHTRKATPGDFFSVQNGESMKRQYFWLTYVRFFTLSTQQRLPPVMYVLVVQCGIIGVCLLLCRIYTVYMPWGLRAERFQEVSKKVPHIPAGVYITKHM